MSCALALLVLGVAQQFNRQRRIYDEAPVCMYSAIDTYNYNTTSVLHIISDILSPRACTRSASMQHRHSGSGASRPGTSSYYYKGSANQS